MGDSSEAGEERDLLNESHSSSVREAVGADPCVRWKPRSLQMSPELEDTQVLMPFCSDRRGFVGCILQHFAKYLIGSPSIGFYIYLFIILPCLISSSNIKNLVFVHFQKGLSE